MLLTQQCRCLRGGVGRYSRKHIFASLAIAVGSEFTLYCIFSAVKIHMFFPSCEEDWLIGGATWWLPRSWPIAGRYIWKRKHGNKPTTTANTTTTGKTMCHNNLWCMKFSKSKSMQVFSENVLKVKENILEQKWQLSFFFFFIIKREMSSLGFKSLMQ